MMTTRVKLQLAIAELRNGTYKQGHGLLCFNRDGKEEYCTLGVLADVAIKNGCKANDPYWGNMKAYGKDRATVSLPAEIQKWYGFEGTKGDNPIIRYNGKSAPVSYWNDTAKLNFTKMADALEQTFLRAI